MTKWVGAVKSSIHSSTFLSDTQKRAVLPTFYSPGFTRPDGQGNRVVSTEEATESTTLSYYEDEPFAEDLFPEDISFDPEKEKEKDDSLSKDSNQIGISDQKSPANATTLPAPGDVPLKIVTSSTPKPWLVDDLDPDDYSYLNTIQGGCFLNGSLYAEGSAVLPRSFCEYCYCIRGKEMCIQPKCHLAIDGCEPSYSSEFSCCPTNYKCASKNYTTDGLTTGTYLETTAASTTTTTTTTTASSTTTITTTSQSSKNAGKLVGLRTDDKQKAVCEADGDFYSEGEAVPGGGHCQYCYCSREGVRCQDIECSPVMEGCQPVIPEGHCCPVEYECNKTSESELKLDLTSTHKSWENMNNETTTEAFNNTAESLDVTLANLLNNSGEEVNMVRGTEETIDGDSKEVKQNENDTTSISDRKTTTQSTVVTFMDYNLKAEFRDDLTDEELEIDDFGKGENDPSFHDVTTAFNVGLNKTDENVLQELAIPINSNFNTSKQSLHNVTDNSVLYTTNGGKVQDITSAITFTDAYLFEHSTDHTSSTEEPNYIKEQNTTTSMSDVYYSQNITDTILYETDRNEIDHTPSAITITDLTMSENETDRLQFESTTEPHDVNSRGDFTIVLLSGNQSNTYVLSVADPDSIRNVTDLISEVNTSPNSLKPTNPLHEALIGDALETTSLRTVNEKDIVTFSSSDPYNPEKAHTDINVNDPKTTSTVTEDARPREPSPTNLPTESSPFEFTPTIPEDKEHGLQTKTGSGKLEKDGMAAVRENDRIIYFSEPDLEQNIKEIFDFEPQKNPEANLASVTMTDNEENISLQDSTTMQTLEEVTKNDSVNENNATNMSKDINEELVVSDFKEKPNKLDTPLIRTSPDGAVLNVYYIGDQIKTTSSTLESNAPVTAEVLDSKLNQSEVPSTTDLDVTADPWSLYYRGPAYSYNRYSVPGEGSSPYLYSPGEGTYYKFETANYAPEKQPVRSPVFSTPEQSPVSSIGGPRKTPDKGGSHVEIITAPTPSEGTENLDFGRHHLYMQDSKQSRSDSDTKVVSLKQIFQVSSSNAAKAAANAPRVTIRFGPAEQPDVPYTGNHPEPKAEGFVPLKQHPTVIVDKRLDAVPVPEEPKEPKPHVVIPFLAEDAVSASGKKNNSIFIGPYKLKESTNSKPGDEQGSCLSDGRYYMNGDMIHKTDPCQLCRCFYGRELCQQQKCPEVPNRDCIAENLPGFCCPRITCGTSDTIIGLPTTGNTKLPSDDSSQSGAALNNGEWKATDKVIDTLQTPLDTVTEFSDIREELEQTVSEKEKDEEMDFKESSSAVLSTTGTNGNITSSTSSYREETPLRSTTLKPVLRTDVPKRKFTIGITNPPLKEDNLWGLLKVSGCNIYGKFYQLDEHVRELSGPCNMCMCSVKGVDCRKTC